MVRRWPDFSYAPRAAVFKKTALLLSSSPLNSSVLCLPVSQLPQKIIGNQETIGAILHPAAFRCAAGTTPSESAFFRYPKMSGVIDGVNKRLETCEGGTIEVQDQAG